MKKTGLIAVALIAVATAAHAEHKLVPTDVAGFKQFEARIDYSYTNDSWKDGGTEKSANKNDASLQLGFGVLEGAEISLRAPYAIRTDSGSSEGVLGDLTLEGKYSLNSILSLPVTVTVGSEFSLNTAKDGYKSAGYAPFIAASQELQGLTPYAVYKGAVIEGDVSAADFSNVHSLKAGAEFELCKHASLDVATVGKYSRGSEVYKNNFAMGAEVAANIEIGKNLYLIPSAAFEIKDDGKFRDGTTAETDSKNVTLGVGLYYYF